MPSIPTSKGARDDARFTRRLGNGVLIAPGTNNSSAAAATGEIFEKTGSAIGPGPLPVNSGALPDSKRDWFPGRQMLPWQKTLLNFHNLEWKNRYFDISLREELFLYWLEWYYWNDIPFIACTYQKEERSLITDIEKARTLWVFANVSPLIAYFAIQAGWDFARVSRWAGRAGGRITGGEDILNGKNESDIRTGLTSVCQLLYFPISCFLTSPYWCTLSPNSPIEKKEISNDRTRPMKADQGFYSLAKRAYYSASITEGKAMCPIDQPKNILIKEWMGSRPGLYC